MSDVGENTFDSLSRLGQLKLVTRLVRFGQVLTPDEFKVLLAIYDRTHGWRRTHAVILDQHFLEGVRARGGWDAAPLGLTAERLRSALDNLVRQNIVRRWGKPHPITYSINIDWEPRGFRSMWRISEGEFNYRPAD